MIFAVLFVCMLVIIAAGIIIQCREQSEVLRELDVILDGMTKKLDK